MSEYSREDKDLLLDSIKEKSNNESQVCNIINSDKYKEYKPKPKQQESKIREDQTIQSLYDQVYEETSLYYHSFPGNGSIKFIANYLIQIPNDEKFGVSRRIIGPKGSTIKQILNCFRFCSEHRLKIRLRGIGSGYKEGSNNEESLDPLQLCVSSINYETFMHCCYRVEILLTRVYKEHREFVKRWGLQVESPSEICKDLYYLTKPYFICEQDVLD